MFTVSSVFLSRGLLQNVTLSLVLCNVADADLMFSVLVPAPKHLTLERQLNKSVLIGWTPPDPPGCNQIESYHVYVDGVLKVTVKATERTRALVEGVDSNRVSSDGFLGICDIVF